MCCTCAQTIHEEPVYRDVCVDVHVDMCVDVRVDVCADVCVCP